MNSTHPPRHNLRFALASVAVLAVACVLRLQPWQANTPQAAQQTVVVTPAATPVPLPPGLAVAVLGFYERVDRGQHDLAYDQILEPQWLRQPDGTYQPAGLTSRQAFLDELAAEFQPNGKSLRIDSIQVLNATPLPLPASPTTDLPEYAALAHLPAGLAPVGLYQVNLSGALGDTCTPWPWDKRLIVADLGDGQFKVLLSGGARPGSNHRIEWFTNLDPFADYRERNPFAANQ